MQFFFSSRSRRDPVCDFFASYSFTVDSTFNCRPDTVLICRSIFFAGRRFHNSARNKCKSVLGWFRFRRSMMIIKHEWRIISKQKEFSDLLVMLAEHGRKNAHEEWSINCVDSRLYCLAAEMFQNSIIIICDDLHLLRVFLNMQCGNLFYDVKFLRFRELFEWFSIFVLFVALWNRQSDFKSG